jgi:hypothetical protein
MAQNDIARDLYMSLLRIAAARQEAEEKMRVLAAIESGTIPTITSSSLERPMSPPYKVMKLNDKETMSRSGYDRQN